MRASRQIVELKKRHCRHCVGGNQKQSHEVHDQENRHSRNFKWVEANDSGSTVQHGQCATGKLHKVELDRFSSCLAGQLQCRFTPVCAICWQVQSPLLLQALLIDY